jgi:hypothetical protein
MLMPVSHIATVDADAVFAGDGPWAETTILCGDHLVTGPASTKQHPLPYRRRIFVRVAMYANNNSMAATMTSLNSMLRQRYNSARRSVELWRGLPLYCAEKSQVHLVSCHDRIIG